MRIKTNLKAGATLNHNEKLVRAIARRNGVAVKTHVKAGSIGGQHNESLVRDTTGRKGISVKTNLKAGISSVKK